MSENVVIVGGGQAGAQTAICLRQNGFAGDITIVGEEPFIPYERPPLSKDFLAGAVARERMFMRAEPFYTDQRITLRLAERVTSIDRSAHLVRLASGDSLPYAHLVLATGGRPRQLSCPGANLPGTHYLRTISDVVGFRDRLTAGARVVIVGGGYIGLEVAAVAVKQGANVSVLEMMPLVLNRVVAPEMSRFYEQVHRERGVDLRTETAVTGFAGSGSVQRVLTSEGAIDADVVIIGIGIVPNAELAADAGLPVDNGIVVDEVTRTADPDIYAVGDCSNHPSALYGGRLRLESVPNALGQGRAAALAILGKPEPYTDVPWFWSDQYDLKLQMAGLSRPGDQLVLRGAVAARKFSACYLRDGIFVACQAVNMVKDFIQSKKLIAAKVRPDPARLADPTLALKDL